ncbi:hypothetical protein VNI00_012737 [Paramarasmius palmivorus]|uniref:Uncharacterized protein n=1 Tax=Paramarasmius palmivorus TaxID=297713 RepID=A0AAW0C4U7_9AGAR
MPPYNHALTRLTLGGTESLSRFRDILARIPTLEQLALHLTCEDVVPGGTSTVLDLPSLRHLRISSHYYPIDEWFLALETFRMPALISFSVDHELDLDNASLNFNVQFPGRPYLPFRTGVTSPLHRCTRSLKILTLECDAVSYEESEITSLAQNLPNLTHLRYTTFAPIVGISPCTAHLLASLQVAHLKPSLDIPSPKLKWLEVRELNFRPRFVVELLERVLATAERRTQRAIASGRQSSNIQPLSNIYVWWNKGGAESEADSGSDYDSEHELDQDHEASRALGHVNPVNDLLLARIKALEQDGIICTVEERDIRPAWCEGFPSVGV